MGLKTIASLGKEKYERIGQTDAKKIISLVSNYSARSGMKPIVKNLGTSKVSVLKFLKRFNKSTDIDKVVRATQKHFNKDIDPAIQKRYLKVNMQKDESGVRNKQMYNIKYAGGAVRTKGVKENINVGGGIKTGFAQAYKNDKLPNNLAPKAPSTGTRPIGL